MEAEHKARSTVVDGIVLRKFIISSSGHEGEILLIKRAKEPELGEWAIPGGFVQWDETATDAVVREVEEETGMKVRPTRIVGVFSDPQRDPTRQTIAVAFLCEPVGGELRGGDDAAEAKWFNVMRLPRLAFDHEKIVKAAFGQL